MHLEKLRGRRGRSDESAGVGKRGVLWVLFSAPLSFSIPTKKGFTLSLTTWNLVD